MSFAEAIHSASKKQSFRAAVYAMNTLLIHKGIYTKKEFEDRFVEWIRKANRKKRSMK
jgi:hypothetical protein